MVIIRRCPSTPIVVATLGLVDSSRPFQMLRETRFAARMGRREGWIGKIEAITHDHAEEGRQRDTKNLHVSSFRQDGRADVCSNSACLITAGLRTLIFGNFSEQVML